MAPRDVHVSFVLTLTTAFRGAHGHDFLLEVSHRLDLDLGGQ